MKVEHFHFAIRNIRPKSGRLVLSDVRAYQRRTRERDLRGRKPLHDTLAYIARAYDYAAAKAEVAYQAENLNGYPGTANQMFTEIDQLARAKNGDYKRNGGHEPRLGSFLTGSISYGVPMAEAKAAVDAFLAFLADEFGCASEAVIHLKRDQADHFHAVVTDRIVSASGVGAKQRRFNFKAQKAAGNAILRGQDVLCEATVLMRHKWAELMTLASGRQVCADSYAAQGLGIEPVTNWTQREIMDQQREGRADWREIRADELRAREQQAAVQQSVATNDGRRRARLLAFARATCASEFVLVGAGSQRTEPGRWIAPGFEAANLPQLPLKIRPAQHRRKHAFGRAALAYYPQVQPNKPAQAANVRSGIATTSLGGREREYAPPVLPQVSHEPRSINQNREGGRTADTGVMDLASFAAAELFRSSYRDRLNERRKRKRRLIAMLAMEVVTSEAEVVRQSFDHMPASSLPLAEIAVSETVTIGQSGVGISQVHRSQKPTSRPVRKDIANIVSQASLQKLGVGPDPRRTLTQAVEAREKVELSKTEPVLLSEGALEGTLGFQHASATNKIPSGAALVSGATLLRRKLEEISRSLPPAEVSHTVHLGSPPIPAQTPEQSFEQRHEKSNISRVITRAHPNGETPPAAPRAACHDALSSSSEGEPKPSSAADVIVEDSQFAKGDHGLPSTRDETAKQETSFMERLPLRGAETLNPDHSSSKSRGSGHRKLSPEDQQRSPGERQQGKTALSATVRLVTEHLTRTVKPISVSFLNVLAGRSTFQVDDDQRLIKAASQGLRRTTSPKMPGTGGELNRTPREGNERRLAAHVSEAPSAKKPPALVSPGSTLPSEALSPAYHAAKYCVAMMRDVGLRAEISEMFAKAVGLSSSEFEDYIRASASAEACTPNGGRVDPSRQRMEIRLRVKALGYASLAGALVKADEMSARRGNRPSAIKAVQAAKLTFDSSRKNPNEIE